jgi:hypothetical protein
LFRQEYFRPATGRRTIGVEVKPTLPEGWTSSMRTLVTITWLCSLSLLASCVSLDKPGPVAACEKAGFCPAHVDSPLDSPGDVPVAQDGDAGALDESPEEDSTGARLDGALEGADTARDGAADGPGLDVGEPGTDTPAVPDTSTDAPAVPDTPTTTPDAPVDAPEDTRRDTGNGETPILSGTCAVDGNPAPAGTVCRVANGLCDVAEVCDGASTACPLDKFKPATDVCRPTAGACDLEEKCTGSSAACPADKFLAKSAVCRAAVSVCDVAEFCDGAIAACPVDVFAPANTQCRASTDGKICDPAESCTGTSNTCPADAKYTRPAAPPTGIAVTPGTLQADVAWTAVTGDAGAGITGYNVKSSTVSGAGYAVRGSPTSSPFTVTPITAGQTYYFVVSAYSGQPTCESVNSSEVSALSCLATAPTALAATPDAAGHVALTWAPPSGAVSYSVSRSTTSGSGYAVVASGLATTSFTDSPVVPASGTATFYYVVRGNTGTCLSPYSTQATAAIVVTRDAGADAAKDAARD